MTNSAERKEGGGGGRNMGPHSKLTVEEVGKWMNIANQNAIEREVWAARCLEAEDALQEIDKWCSGENQVDDGEDAEDALRYIQDAIKAFLSGRALPTPADAQPSPSAEQRARELELKLRAMVKWLEENQPDVFRRGLWDALSDSELSQSAAPEGNSLFNWYTRQKRGFIFSKRYQIVKAMEAVMLEKERELTVADPAAAPEEKK
jgi:hypothetical protein